MYAPCRVALEHPFELQGRHVNESVRYTPAESETRQFGGNSNWRGPIWFPLNFLIIESLQKFHHYYGNDFKVECPTGSGKFLTLEEVASELAQRLSRIFLKDGDGRSTGPASSAATADRIPITAIAFRSTNIFTATPAGAAGHRINRAGHR